MRHLGWVMAVAAVLAAGPALAPPPADAAACTKARAINVLQMANGLKSKAAACQRAVASRSRTKVCSSCGTFVRASKQVYGKLSAVGISCQGAMSAAQYQKLQSDRLYLGNANRELSNVLASGC